MTNKPIYTLALILMFSTSAFATTLIIEKEKSCPAFYLRITYYTSSSQDTLFDKDYEGEILRYTLTPEKTVNEVLLYINKGFHDIVGYNNHIRIKISPLNDTVRIVFQKPSYDSCKISFKNKLYEDLTDNYRIAVARNLYTEKAYFHPEEGNNYSEIIDLLDDSVNKKAFEIAQKYRGSVESFSMLCDMAFYRYSKDSLRREVQAYKKFSNYPEYTILKNYINSIEDSSKLTIEKYKVYDKQLKPTHVRLSKSKINLIVYFDKSCHWTDAFIKRMNNDSTTRDIYNIVLVLMKDEYSYWNKNFEKIKFPNAIYFEEKFSPIHFDLKLNRSPALLLFSPKGKVITMDDRSFFN